MPSRSRPRCSAESPSASSTACRTSATTGPQFEDGHSLADTCIHAPTVTPTPKCTPTHTQTHNGTRSDTRPRTHTASPGCRHRRSDPSVARPGCHRPWPQPATASAVRPSRLTVDQSTPPPSPPSASDRMHASTDRDPRRAAHCQTPPDHHSPRTLMPHTPTAPAPTPQTPPPPDHPPATPAHRSAPGAEMRCCAVCPCPYTQTRTRRDVHADTCRPGGSCSVASAPAASSTTNVPRRLPAPPPSEAWSAPRLA